MEVKNFSKESSDFTGNSWLLKTEKGSTLIDVGTGDCWNRIKKFESLDKVVITHSHYDHIDNLSKVEKEFSADIYCFESENLSEAAKEVGDGDKIELSGISFKIFHTPGHKNDSICLYSPEEKILFTGNLIFPEGGFGRTDLEEGNRDKLIESIEKLADLDVDEMYCGHEPAAERNMEEQIQSSLENARKRQPKY